MIEMKSVYKPTAVEAWTVIGLVVFIISFGIIKWAASPQIPILCAILFLLGFGLVKKIPYHQLEQGFVQGAMSGIGAVFILIFIGVLLASWMISGTIPTLIYSGFSIVTPRFFYSIVFIVTALIGVSIGSSLTTVATVGVAFMSVAMTLDLSLPIMAGTIVSGAFFGDKMSPLSDTTNLASTILKVDLFEHIRNMGWTTIPAFVLSLITFGILSPSIEHSHFPMIARFQEHLIDTNLVHWYSWLPLIVMILLSLKKVPALLSLAVSSLIGVLLSFFHLKLSGKELFTILYDGYVSNTGDHVVDALLTRGGISSMLFTVSLVLLALGMGGLLFVLGIVPKVIQTIEHLLTTVGSCITAAALTAVGINFVIGEQYLSILLTGESYQASFERVGLARKNLSRVLEDAGTVVNPLVPWSVCGVFITSVLGVSTVSYFPFALFCLFSPILTILFGLTGKTLTYLKKE